MTILLSRFCFSSPSLKFKHNKPILFGLAKARLQPKVITKAQRLTQWFFGPNCNTKFTLLLVVCLGCGSDYPPIEKPMWGLRAIKTPFLQKKIPKMFSFQPKTEVKINYQAGLSRFSLKILWKDIAKVYGRQFTALTESRSSESVSVKLFIPAIPEPPDIFSFVIICNQSHHSLHSQHNSSQVRRCSGLFVCLGCGLTWSPPEVCMDSSYEEGQLLCYSSNATRL